MLLTSGQSSKGRYLQEEIEVQVHGERKFSHYHSRARILFAACVNYGFPRIDNRKVNGTNEEINYYIFKIQSFIVEIFNCVLKNYQCHIFIQRLLNVSRGYIITEDYQINFNISILDSFNKTLTLTIFFFMKMKYSINFNNLLFFFKFFGVDISSYFCTT